MMDCSSTCIIPTRNRADFMRRCVQFLERQDQHHNVLIADSSSDSVFDANLAMLKASSLGNVRVLKFDESSGFYEKICMAIDRVTTPYFYFMADDDFIFSDGVEKCVQELERDASLIAAAGTLYVYNLSRQGQLSRFLPHALSVYPQKSEVSSDNLLRVHNHLNNYSATFYSVYRTATAKEAFAAIARRTGHMRLAEIFSSAYVLALGSRKLTPHLFGLRTSHEQAAHLTIPKIKDETDKPAFRAEFAAAFEGLVALVKQSGGAHSEGSIRRTLRAGCGAYLRKLGLETETVAEITHLVGSEQEVRLVNVEEQTPVRDIVDVDGGASVSEPPGESEAPSADALLFAIGLCEIAPLGLSAATSPSEASEMLRSFLEKSPVASFSHLPHTHLLHV